MNGGSHSQSIHLGFSSAPSAHSMPAFSPCGDRNTKDRKGFFGSHYKKPRIEQQHHMLGGNNTDIRQEGCGGDASRSETASESKQQKTMIQSAKLPENDFAKTSSAASVLSSLPSFFFAKQESKQESAGNGNVITSCNLVWRSVELLII
ncbi:hypothetical protein AB6A40_011557 [Gnathostoma spinigerum]|uniref:Uncharacterized protein n=1 Tax=Gnathostoma spinigerum TaxID=75299 RepID=A0ABD6EY03_9BILA